MTLPFRLARLSAPRAEPRADPACASSSVEVLPISSTALASPDAQEIGRAATREMSSAGMTGESLTMMGSFMSLRLDVRLHLDILKCPLISRRP